MNWKRAIILLVLMLALPLFALAQDDDKGREWGDYTVRQSIELGGHIVDSHGNQQMYFTFVNLASGPRLLSQELSMQSRSHQGLLFDNLYVSGFGFGGDPENMARLRMSKSKLYNFTGLYRRDKNFFDFNLFANPMNLNPGITTCGAGCTNAFSPTSLFWYTNSPHLQATTRNMGDFLLTLLPDSAYSFRLGYARNANYGTIDTSLEAPIRTILTEYSQWKSDRYQFGADIKALPRTTLSFDVFFEHDKNDLGFVDGNSFFNLGNASGPQVDIGVLLPPLSGAVPSCNTPAAAIPIIQAGSIFIINSGCNGVLLNTGPGGAYSKRGNIRTDIPTGQFSFASNYIRKLDVTGSGTYSSGNSDYLNFTEFMHGSTSTLNTASPNARHVSANADLGLTYHLSKSWSVSDKFRWLNWREPGALTNTSFTCMLPSVAGTTLGTPVGFPAGAVTLTSLLNPCNSTVLALTGLTTAGNAAATTNYETITSNTTLVGEHSYFNTARVNWQPSRRLSGYLGYRYTQRMLREGNLAVGGELSAVTSTFPNTGTGVVPTVPVCVATTTGCNTATGIVTTTGTLDSLKINMHTALIGVVVRPIDALRISGDVELLSADNSFVDIAPRSQQRFRVYSTYKVHRWAQINGGVHLVETRNGFGPSETIDTGVSGNTCTAATNPNCLLFPLNGTAITPYGHKDHWRYYTLGVNLNPNPKFMFDIGWTLLDQDVRSATCMPITGTGGVFAGTVTAPSACNSNTVARALLLDYQENTNSAYTNISYHPVKQVTVMVGYDISGDTGRNNWLRLDNGSPLMVVGDIYGNSPPLAGNAITPCPGASVATGCVFAGPFPDQPIGPQAITWHKATAGLSYEVVKGVQFKGVWSYYDYNSKDSVPALALLQVVSPRDFHANVGTLSLKYTF